ncbi:MAG: peptidoglycan DD-metalloendopeptidase family protein [Bacteroidaceae bacterium]|nr:peptidoglycan DD-metalloendopeptidase family protein [Bacteroidaceae bacterium]
MNRQNSLKLLILLVFSMATLVAGAQSAAIKNMRAQAGNLRKEIADKEKILISSQNDVRSKLNNLDIINAQLREVRKLVSMLQNEVRLVNAEISLYNKEIEQQEAVVEQSRAEYAEALRRSRKYSSFQNKLSFIFSADDFNTMVRRYRYAGEYMNAHLAFADSLKVEIERLDAKKTELEATLALKAEALKEQQSEREKIQVLEKKQRKIVESLKREAKKVEKELKNKRAQLNKLNASIEREIERVLAAEAAAKKKAEGSSTVKTNTGKSDKTSPIYNDDAGVIAMTGDFQNNKKKMPVPITGPYLVVERYGVKNAISGKGNVPINTGGITIEGSKGAQARSVFKGKVTAVFDNGSYTFVLVRHGKYISVYCNLANVRVKGGEELKAGDIIGDIENDAKGGNPRMLFQLRHEKTTLDPTEWLKI